MATVVRDGEGRVPGLLWALSDEDLERLDASRGQASTARSAERRAAVPTAKRAGSPTSVGASS